MGQAHPEPDGGRVGDRDPAALRGRRLRRGVHARTARAGRAAAGGVGGAAGGVTQHDSLVFSISPAELAGGRFSDYRRRRRDPATGDPRPGGGVPVGRPGGLSRDLRPRHKSRRRSSRSRAIRTGSTWRPGAPVPPRNPRPWSRSPEPCCTATCGRRTPRPRARSCTCR